MVAPSLFPLRGSDRDCGVGCGRTVVEGAGALQSPRTGGRGGSVDDSILRMLNVLVVGPSVPRGEGIADSSFDCGRAIAGCTVEVAVVALSRPVNADFAFGRGQTTVKFGSDCRRRAVVGGAGGICFARCRTAVGGVEALRAVRTTRREAENGADIGMEEKLWWWGVMSSVSRISRPSR
jgi:hypothetical protein